MANDATTELGDLRSLVRQVLRDVLPTTIRDAADSPRALPQVAEEVVDLRDDADLAAFVERVLQLADTPERREDLRSGRIRFHLAPTPPQRAPRVADPAPAAAPPPAPTRRIERGAVTEAHVKEAARSGARLLLGARAILTPLARDRARVLGVGVEREP